MTVSTFGFAKPEDSPGFLLWQTTIVWQRLIKQALEPYNISHAQFVILAILLWCEETKLAPIQSFIVNKSKLDKMTVSQALKKLVADKLVKRNEHAVDTRAKAVVLTSKGRIFIKKIVPIVESVDEKYFGVLQDKSQKVFIDFLNELVGNCSPAKIYENL